ncbi:His Kinase A (phosphoacceptor) domain [Rhizoctonia solani]|uniref:histidine kinase n=1 Tax=Rhizoctonia solani TaxID=456999 RepID=A0A8H7IH79_9AGAM|nr:His Kinase A (phosphoacceptor) domain [Rhizoctonia solani]
MYRTPSPTSDDGVPPADDLPRPAIASTVRKTTRFQTGLKVHWARFKSQLGTGSALSESAIEASAGESTEGSSNYRRYIEKVGGRNTPAVGPADDGPVDEIVVDNQFLVPGEKSVTQPSEPRLNSHGIPASDSYFEGTANSIWDKHPALVALRYRILPFLWRFFNLSFHDPEAESHYLKERYYTKKRLAFFTSLFFILNWILALALIPRPLQTIDHVFYYGVAPAITVPGPLCGFYGQPSYWSCGNRDFLGLFYFTTGLPVMALFGMHQHRLPAALAASIIAILMGVLVIPWRTSWSRNLINFIIYQVFLLYLHFMYETAERRLHKLRDQLKTQYKATQKAQVSERKAADSKRRLTSYIFHEVRVPLNTALLATQNMAAAMTLSKEHDVEFNALEAADARGLELISEFDPAIDETIRKANQGDEIKRGLVNGGMVNQDDYEEDAVVLGDEMRLRQIITNLASNAAKFTEAGGKIFIRTKLLIATPSRPNPFASQSQSGASGVSSGSGGDSPSSSEGTHIHIGEKESRDSHSYPRPIEQIVVRIEVEDTGVGIRKKDLVDNRLFSAFNQTEVGRLQGGKGTGLGLALVRHIVRLSGGRLGVKSERDVGSMFWVELSLGVGRRVNNAIARNKSKDDALTNIARSRIIERSGFVLDASSGVGPEPHDITPSTIASNPSDIGFVPTLPIESNAALKTIIEHGGMVELASRRPRAPAGTGEVPIVVTRNMDSADASALANAALGQAGILASGATKDATTGVTSTTDASAPSTNVDSTSDLATTHATPIATTPKTVHQLSGRDPSDALIKKDLPLARLYLVSTTVEKTNTLNVLIVDDDPLTRRLMSRMLTRLGCTCETAENGLIALVCLLPEIHKGYANAGDRNAVGTYDWNSIDRDPPPSTNSELSGTNAQGMGKYAVVFLDNQCDAALQWAGGNAPATIHWTPRLCRWSHWNALKEDQEEYYEAGVDHVLTKPVLERSLKQMLVMADERRRTQPQQGTAMSS